jgi:hypothetical protein
MHDTQDDISVLEPTQLSAATRQALARRKLDKGTMALLILLRVYVFIAIPIVAYAFIRAMQGHH